MKLLTSELVAIMSFIPLDLKDKNIIEMEEAYLWAKKKLLKIRKNNERNRNKERKD